MIGPPPPHAAVRMPSIRETLLSYAQGQSTPVDAIAAACSAIDRHNPLVNAVPTQVPRDALFARAERLTAAIRAGEPVGALAGLPWVAKDTHRTAGLRTTFGSPIFADHVPDRDEPIVRRLADADCLLLGKSNTPEFAAGSQTFNPIFGTTRNPYAPDRTVGGSTGGGACALATGMAAVADGSDLAASLRNPASFCGVVGYRPSTLGDPMLETGANAYGALSMVGAMGRSVDDVRLANRAVYAPAPRRPIADWAQALRAESQTGGRGRLGSGALPRPRDPKRLRVAFTIDGGGQMPVDAPVRRAMRQVADRLRDAGVELVDACPPMAEADDCFQVLRGLYFVENLGPLYETDRARLKDTVAWNVEVGLGLSAARIGAAQRTRSALVRRMAGFLGEFDAFLLPTAQVLPFSHRVPYPAEVDGQPLGTYIDWLRSCYWITVSGHPAVSIPCGWQADGDGTRLPVGLQLVGRFGRDEALLDVAETVETLLAPLLADPPAFACDAGAG